MVRNSPYPSVLYYLPPAGDSIDMPIMEAMCIVGGGTPTPEHDARFNDVHLSTVVLQQGGFEKPTRFLWGDDVARLVNHDHKPLRIVVNINGVDLWISNKTSLDTAMKRLHRKLKQAWLTGEERIYSTPSGHHEFFRDRWDPILRRAARHRALQEKLQGREPSGNTNQHS